MPKVMAVVLSLLLFSTLSFTEKENSGNGSGNNSGGNQGHSGEAPNPSKPGNDDSDGPDRSGSGGQLSLRWP